MGDGDAKAKQPALPAGAPKDLTAFLECTAATVTVKGGTMGWVGKVDMGVGEIEPDITFTAGEKGAINISVGKSIFSVTLPASITDGRLTIDTGSLPDKAADFVNGWVNDLNGWLKSKGKQFGAAKLDKGAVTLTKVPLPPAATDKPADKPVKAPIGPPMLVDPSPPPFTIAISTSPAIGSVAPVAPITVSGPSRSDDLIARANHLDADIQAGRAGDRGAALASLDALIALFDDVLDQSRAQDLATFIQAGSSSHFDAFEQKLQMLTRWRDQIASAGLPVEPAPPEVQAILDSVGPTPPAQYGWEAKRAGGRGTALVVGAGGLLFLAGALVIVSGALGGKAPSSSTAPPGVVASGSPAAGASAPTESVLPSAATVITDNELVDNVGSPCSASTTLHMKWVITGAPPGAAVVVDMSGPGLPSQATFTIGDDGSIVTSYTVPPGAAVWTTDLATIGGRPAPVANATNKSTVTCSGP